VVVGGAGDPGDEDAVRMVDEVLAGERIDEVAFAAPVRGGDGDDLPVAGRPAMPTARASSPSPWPRTATPRRGRRGGRSSATPRRSRRWPRRRRSRAGGEAGLGALVACGGPWPSALTRR
jgi:hypothetical protein